LQLKLGFAIKVCLQRIPRNRLSNLRHGSQSRQCFPACSSTDGQTDRRLGSVRPVRSSD
jgi:hypothetical protein